MAATTSQLDKPRAHPPGSSARSTSTGPRQHGDHVNLQARAWGPALGKPPLTHADSFPLGGDDHDLLIDLDAILVPEDPRQHDLCPIADRIHLKGGCGMSAPGLLCQPVGPPTPPPKSTPRGVGLRACPQPQNRANGSDSHGLQSGV